MGVDFLSKQAKGFTKKWDRDLVKHSTPNLFTREPAYVGRASVARSLPGHSMTCGEGLIIRSSHGKLLAFRETLEVGYFVSPPPDLVQEIEECGGFARGEVLELVDDGRVAEVKVC